MGGVNYSGPGFYKKAISANHEEKSSNQHLSMTSASGPTPRFLPCLNSCQNAFKMDQEVQCKQNKSFLPQVSFVMVFIIAKEILMKTVSR